MALSAGNVSGDASRAGGSSCGGGAIADWSMVTGAMRFPGRLLSHNKVSPPRVALAVRASVAKLSRWASGAECSMVLSGLGASSVGDSGYGKMPRVASRNLWPHARSLWASDLRTSLYDQRSASKDLRSRNSAIAPHARATSTRPRIAPLRHPRSVLRRLSHHYLTVQGRRLHL
jgi:hypothetical protein